MHLLRIISLLLLCASACKAQFGFDVSSGFAGALSTVPGAASGGTGAPGIESFVTNIYAAGFGTGLNTNKVPVIAGAQKVVAVFVAHIGDATFELPAVLTMNGVDFTNHVFIMTNDASYCAEMAFWTTNLVSGTTNEVVYQAGATKSRAGFGIIVFTNCNVTTPIGNSAGFASASTNSLVVTVASSTSEIVIGAANTDVQNTLTNTSATLQYVARNLGSDWDFGGTYSNGAASVTMSWSTGTGNSAAIAFGVKGP